MKKALLGTSALVGAGLLAFSPAPASANELELSISGNLQFGTYVIDGEDYSNNRISANYADITLTNGGTAGADARICWNGDGGDDAVFSGVLMSEACGDNSTGAVQIGTAPISSVTTVISAGTIKNGSFVYPAGGSVGSDDDGTTRAAVDSNDFGIVNSFSRIVFDSKGVLDSGLKVGSRVRLEATTQNTGKEDSANPQVDEHFVWVEGGFGRFVAGSKNSAAYDMHYGTPWFTNNGVDSPNFRNNQRSSAGSSTFFDLTSDAYKLTYFTPRFSGVQLGVSFTPDGSSANNATRNNAAYNTRDVDLQDVFSLGGNYVNTVGDVDVGVSGGYESGTARDKNPNGTTVAAAESEDPNQWNVGLNLGMGGWSVGGSYQVEENKGRVKDRERNAWSTGVKYSEGPWSVGAGYFQGTVEEKGLGDKETTFLLLNAGYKLGAGVNLGFDVQVLEDTDPVNVPDTAGEANVGNPETIKTNSAGLTLAVGF